MTEGPIVIVEPDLQSQQHYRQVIHAIGVSNQLRFFDNAQNTLDYLHTTDEHPFLILSEVNLPGINGLQMKEAIFSDDYLRNKSIPFVFISTDASAESICKAYKLNVQGYFEKPHITYLEAMMIRIFEYWEWCKHINNT